MCLLPPGATPDEAVAVRAHLRLDVPVRVLADARGSSRRRRDRRSPALPEPSDAEKRRIRNADGRRVAERRARLVAAHDLAIAAPQLHGVTILRRLAPTQLIREDADTARLVTRIQAGEQGLLQDLYLRYNSRVLAYMRKRLGDPHAAEDATQDVFMRAMTAVFVYELRGAPFRAWLFRIARNCAIDRLREQRSMVVVDPFELTGRIEAESPVAGAPAGPPDALVLPDAVAQLPPLQRQVIFSRYAADLSGTDTAVVVGRSPEAERQLHHRAIATLRARL